MTSNNILSMVIMLLLVSCADSPKSVPPGMQTVCTMEARICPGGSMVGRTGPNCEFAPCPGSSD